MTKECLPHSLVGQFSPTELTMKNQTETVHGTSTDTHQSTAHATITQVSRKLTSKEKEIFATIEQSYARYSKETERQEYIDSLYFPIDDYKSVTVASALDTLEQLGLIIIDIEPIDPLRAFCNNYHIERTRRRLRFAKINPASVFASR